MTATSEITRARVTAGDIQVGDRVARSRGMAFLEVVELKRLVVTVRLHFEDGSIDWPRLDASWWRELPLGAGAGYSPSADQTVAFEETLVGERVGPAAS
jgi:hypothetical protein